MTRDTTAGATQSAASADNVVSLADWLRSNAPQPADGGFPEPSARRDPELHPAGQRRRFTVRLALNEVEPPVWRRLQLASDMTLERLHDVIQAAMGWADCHLHQFMAGPGERDWDIAPFLTDFAREEGDGGIHEADVHLDQVLSEVGDRLHYEYDFGDGWWHTIRLEDIGPWPEGEPDALCLTGERACPPEDVGGIGGYAEVLEFMAGNTDGHDPGWVETKLAWMPDGFDPEQFDVGDVNDLLKLGPTPSLDDIHPAARELISKTTPFTRGVFTLISTAAAHAAPVSGEEITRSVHRYAKLLEIIGDGIKLTTAGYLPPLLVSTIYRELNMGQEWIGRGNREDQTLPVLDLRESAIAAGLLRKSKSQLLPTAAARRHLNDPAGLWNHVVDRIPLGKAHERDAGALGLFNLAATGNPDSAPMNTLNQMSELGWNTRQASPQDAAAWAQPTMLVLATLARGLAATEPGHRSYRVDDAALIRVARAVVAHGPGRH